MSQDEVLEFSPEKKLKTRAIYATVLLAELVVPKGAAEKGKLHVRWGDEWSPGWQKRQGSPSPFISHQHQNQQLEKRSRQAQEETQVPILECQA